ncbi:ArsA-related P-loop ATPase [Conexibacter sp. JD483]|uniref:ArsA family ATPase n=1 Tax=unclassified Conexibacter TaxID=2627773 RepID=UPI002718348F|nr:MULTISPECIES: ArsA-related P-loop ATPase [unclassified Conexibacter]MDO8186720.1 ArsA-related P-loop ATPase [Conexibacter sp. CPCC 205706]MDO8199006.1 ArsA-related P-loop ATPase [Conexibacter sp. CPCC 205762]MDR9368458.1 ArsA-related P-loop ATPase [Conexibacter sp. JD483]
MAGLSDKRLLFLTGKGGVGKSTVAIALGIAAARRGLRCCVAELTGQDRAAVAFGHRDGSSGARELRLAQDLWTISIEPQHALEEYLSQKAGPFGDVLAGSRTFHGFVQATPGMRELLTLGKAWELAQPQRRTAGARPYDLVIVDAPATGHGLAALSTPRTFAEIAKVGPIASQGRTLDAFFTDPDAAAVVAVALAEEMPVNETLRLRRELREQLGIELAATVVNALLPDRLGPRQGATVAQAEQAAAKASPLVTAALRAARSEHVRAAAQRAQVARLAEGLGSAPLELPYLFTPAVDVAGLELLSERLEELL